jgi:hypothetical protein
MFGERPDPRPALRTFYAVAGRSLCVDALDEWSATVVERYFRDWYLAPVARAEAARPDATIRIRRGGPVPPLPAALDSFHLGDGWRCYTDGRAYHLDIEGSRVIIGDASHEGVEVWVEPGASVGSPALAQTVFNAFSGAMRRCGLFELHSAGVVGPDGGAGALLVGVSGSGKSTLTMQLAAAGWGYLSDDVLLLRECDGRVETRPLRKVFAATEQTVAAAGLGGRTADALTQVNNKLRFAPQTFFPGGHVECSFPRVIFFPSVAHEPTSRVGELPRPEALARLLRMCPWACYDRPTSAEYLGVLALLSKQCRAFEVRAGRDLLDSPTRAAALLAPHVRR